LFTDIDNIRQLASESLQKIRSKKEEDNQKEKLVEENLKNFDYTKRLVEEYNDDSFVNKINSDIHFYNIFLKNSNTEVLPRIQEELGKYIQIIKEVYEFINIKPKAILNSSNTNNQECEKKAKEIINEGINKYYYSLTKSEVDKKYKNAVINETMSLVINEDLNPKSGVEAVTKALVLENLLFTLNFPLQVQGRIVDLLNSETYGRFFDQDVLQETWDNFKIQNKEISRIFGSLV
jgi:hypothetical protein